MIVLGCESSVGKGSGRQAAQGVCARSPLYQHRHPLMRSRASASDKNHKAVRPSAVRRPSKALFDHVVGRRAQLRVFSLDRVEVCPLVELATDELWPMVHPNAPRTAREPQKGFKRVDEVGKVRKLTFDASKNSPRVWQPTTSSIWDGRPSNRPSDTKFIVSADRSLANFKNCSSA